MPSPYPGMDPYLESDLWTTFHTQNAVELARPWSPSLPTRYAAITAKQFGADSLKESAIGVQMIPDVGATGTTLSGGSETLDLQQASTNVSDLFNYEYVIDYSCPLKIPLPAEAECRLDQLLRVRGKR